LNGTSSYETYQQLRGGAALSLSELLPISVAVGTQPCSTFGLHPALPLLKTLYDAGDASILANVGPLVEPTSKEEFLGTGDERRLPPALFAHNTQVKATQSVHAQNNVAKGVLGRLVDVVSSQSPSYKARAYSVSGIAKMLEGEVTQSVLDKKLGVRRLENRDALAPLIDNMTRYRSQSIFAETFAATLHEALASSEHLGAELEPLSLATTFPSESLAQQLEQTARVIKARAALGEERQVFFVSLGGFDTHASELESVAEKFAIVNEALTAFVDEMKAQGVWEQVALLEASDFGRTLGSNGAGTDHAWGGHYFLLGGGIDGARILGKYPSRLDETAEENIGRNHRMLPTTSWEMVWHGLCEWFGADVAQISSEILPNLDNFPVEGRLRLFS